MMKPRKWLEREFRFDLPPWMFPNTVERVRGGPARAEDAVNGLPASVLTRKPAGGWTIQEHIGHLGDLEPLWATRLTELIDGASHLTAWDETNRRTHEADHNSRSLEEILRYFRDSRTRLVSRLDAHDTSHVERSALHPRLETPVRVIDLAYFVAEHDDHHLANVSRLKRDLG